MGARYRQYKSDHAGAVQAEEEYDERLLDIPRPPPKKDRDPIYKGSPSMVPSHHQQMSSHSKHMVDMHRRLVILMRLLEVHAA